MSTAASALKTRNRLLMVGMAVAGGLLLLFILLILALGRNAGGIASGSGGIGLLNVTGVIASGRPYLAQLDELTTGTPVPALLVRIDSPGGGAAASQELFSELCRVRDSGIPVVVSMGSVAASGGYYAAAAADVIFANPGTITGSIGVISELPNTRKLFEMLGIRFNVVKSGKYKDAGNPSRELTAGDRRLLQELVDDIHGQFRDDIARSRNLPDGTDKLMSDGRVVTGRRALELGLVDTLGNFNDAVRHAGMLAGIKGRPELIEKKRRNLMREWLSEAADAATRSASAIFFEKKYLLYQP